jgi:Protein of unknown function (DUF3224)
MRESCPELLAVLLFLTCAMAQTQPDTPKETAGNHATGQFDVKTSASEDKSLETLLGRFSLDKQYHGDLEATGKGQRLTASTEMRGSAGYVAIEKVSGSLKGRSGSFVLQHAGTMIRGVPHLIISVVPDSGTGDLKGISGKMSINIAPEGKHSYDLEYTLKTD